MSKNITVWDYADVWNGSSSWHKVETNTEYNVKAWCVGGVEGILAFFFHEDKFCIAAGDDGHWWLIYTCHKDWFKTIKKVFKDMVVNHG
jgi:hypothetical protein